jgi:hypothetical protein
MKSTVVAAFIVGLLATSCTRNQISVKSNNDFQSNNTENRSFTIVQEASNPQERKSLLNEMVIIEEIKKQMKIRGYVESVKDADVLISYSVYNKNLLLQEVNKVNTEASLQKEMFDVYRKHLKNGTLIITMIDNNSSKVFWTGYASKILRSQKNLGDRDLKNITRAIFDNYRVTANHFLAKNN